jgi:hypothetical protein
MLLFSSQAKLAPITDSREITTTEKIRISAAFPVAGDPGTHQHFTSMPV